MEDTRRKNSLKACWRKQERAESVGSQPWTSQNKSEYIAAIGGQFTLSVSQYEDQDTFPHARYALVLKDQDGRVLTKITNVDASIGSKDIRELSDTARR